MRVLLTTYGSRGDIQPPVGFDTVAAAVEEGDAPIATGVMPTGGWR